VPARGKTSLLVALLLATGLPAASGAQVAAPRLVEDGDEPGELETLPELPAREPPIRRAAPPSPEVEVDAGSQRGARAPTSTSTPASAPPAPPAMATTTSDLARRIQPVSTTHARLMELWVERRVASRESDVVRAEAAERAVVAAKRELAIENLVAMAVAEIREADRARLANLPAEALARARVAVELAPDLPDAHIAHARALFAEAPTRPGPPLAALGEAFAAAAREPHTIRAFLGDVASAGFAAVFTAAIAVALLLVLRRLRLFLHDVHHLPIFRDTAPAQASFVALVLLALPAVFGLGPLFAVAAALLAVWLHLARAERLVATAALLALVALPWATGEAARAMVWTGSLAEQVHELEQGALSEAEAAEVAARFADRPAPAAVHAALGRHHKRRGDLDAALRHYALAAGADGGAPELHVNVGNVLFLRGDLEGAKAAYLAATDRAGPDLVVLGAAHYGLSKLYLRTSDMDKSASAREKAEREAGAFLRRFGSDDDYSANRYLVDVPVRPSKIRALAEADGSPEAVSAWVRRRVAGPLPRAAWPWAPLGVVAALWLLVPWRRRIAPATACDRCGGAACRRCDDAAGAHCGQCVNVFERKGVVDARDRLRKEAQVRRHAAFRHHTTRVLAVVSGGAGHVFGGAPVKGALLLVAMLFAGFVLWFWRGVMPPPQPSPYVLACKIAVAAPLGLAVWVIGVRDAFRRTSE
jgi:tetratricopeptide (TPR) repeat protein